MKVEINEVTQKEIDDLLKGVVMGRKNEVLSQAEIDQLLSAIASGEDEVDDFKPVTRNKRIKIYDFKRPDVFSREQLRTISYGFEKIARDWTVLLAGITKSICHVHVASVDQLTYEETIRAIPTPTPIKEFMIDRGLNRAYLQMDPSPAFYTMSKLGIKYPENWRYDTVLEAIEKNGNRDLHDCERNTFDEKVVAPMLAVLRNTLQKYFLIENPEISFDKDSVVESNPQFCNNIKPTDMVCLVTFECKFTEGDKDYEGMINVCLSQSTVMHLVNSYNEVIPDECPPLNFNKIMETKVPVEVLLGGTQMSLNKIKDIGEGTIIELDKLAGMPVDIRINGEILAQGEVVVIDENFGVRVVGMIE